MIASTALRRQLQVGAPHPLEKIRLFKLYPVSLAALVSPGQADIHRTVQQQGVIGTQLALNELLQDSYAVWRQPTTTGLVRVNNFQKNQQVGGRFSRNSP